MSRPKPPPNTGAAQFNANPFAALKLDLPGLPPAAPDEGVSASAHASGPAATSTVAPSQRPPDKQPPVHVRFERKGRGGKTVTVIGGFCELPPPQLLTLTQQLRKALGTGGVALESEVELQGDQRLRAAAWLRGQGWRVKGDLPAG